MLGEAARWSGASPTGPSLTNRPSLLDSSLAAASTPSTVSAAEALVCFHLTIHATATTRRLRLCHSRIIVLLPTGGSTSNEPRFARALAATSIPDGWYLLHPIHPPHFFRRSALQMPP